MDLVRRFRNRDGAEEGGNQPALEDEPEPAVRAEDRQLIGQELVPAGSVDHRALIPNGEESGKGYGAGGARREVVQPGQSLMETPERRDGKGSRVPRISIATPVSAAGLGGGDPSSGTTPIQEEDGSKGREEDVEFWSSQRHPWGPPMVFGPPAERDPRQPLFDQQQLQRLQQLQMQASWIYHPPRPAGEYIPHVPRPEILELEEMKRSQEELKKQYESEIALLRQEVLRLKRSDNESKEVELGSGEEMPKFSTPEEHERKPKVEEKTVREDGAQDRPRESGSASSGKEDPTTIQVMMKLMEGMQAMQQRMLDDREDDRAGSVESVQGYIQPLPELCEWNPATGPIDLGDWLSLIEPIMSDLSKTSGDWWHLLIREALSWYDEHQQLAPLKRIHHDPQPSSKLCQPKWCRLERRASTMLLRALPQTARDEMVSTKKLSALGIICQLLKSYQPGGLGEKELVLKSLETPAEANNLGEAVQGLRQWTRWRRRAHELQITET